MPNILKRGAWSAEECSVARFLPSEERVERSKFRASCKSFILKDLQRNARLSAYDEPSIDTLCALRVSLGGLTYFSFGPL